MKKYINTPDQKENKYPEMNLEVTESCNINDREFKIAIIKKLNELQENTEKEFNESETSSQKRLEL